MTSKSMSGLTSNSSLGASSIDSLPSLCRIRRPSGVAAWKAQRRAAKVVCSCCTTLVTYFDSTCVASMIGSVARLLRRRAAQLRETDLAAAALENAPDMKLWTRTGCSTRCAVDGWRMQQLT